MYECICSGARRRATGLSRLGATELSAALPCCLDMHMYIKNVCVYIYIYIYMYCPLSASRGRSHGS